MKVTYFLISLLLLVALAQAEEVNTFSQDLETLQQVLDDDAVSLNVAKSVSVEVDSKNSNDGWIQLLVTPGGLVNSITATLTVKGGKKKTFSVRPCSWDAERYIGFCASLNPVAKMNTPMTLSLKLRNGKTANARATYKKGSKVSVSITAQEQFGSGAPSSPGTVKTGSASSDVKKLVAIVSKWREAAGGPKAQVGKPGPSYNDADWDLLQKHKIALDNILKGLGIRDIKTKAVLFTIFGIETERMYRPDGFTEGDRGKKGPSENFSPANMNRDLIINFVKHPQVSERNIHDLNYLKNLKLAVEVAIKGIVKLGIVGFLNFHRGGQTGWRKPKKCERCLKIKMFRQGIHNVVNRYKANPSMFREGNKVYSIIDYVSDWSCCN